MRKNLASEIVKIALAEDCVFNDITSDFTISEKTSISFAIKAREEIIFCGKEIITEVFSQLKKSPKFKNSDLKIKIFAADGDVLKSTRSIAEGHGDAKLIFAAERVILNLIQHLSGVATTTKKFVNKLNNKKIQILDTRKTLPGLRSLQKYAVVVGGGKNHRLNLSDMILIKDNHIAAAGGVQNALIAAKKQRKKSQKIEVECDSYAQVAEAVGVTPDVIMLDNMSLQQIRKSSALIRKKSPKTKIEISGGVNLGNVSRLSKLDIDFISIGAITHSAKAADIGLDIMQNKK